MTAVSRGPRRPAAAPEEPPVTPARPAASSGRFRRGQAARSEPPPAGTKSPAPVREPRGPRAKTAAPGPLPAGRGLWYRAHPADALDLDQGKARSRSLETPGIGQAGLSAFASPHHLYSYLTELNWAGRGWLHGHDDGQTPRRAVAFHGREVGRGDDDEPLIRPEPDASCCGRVVHSHLAWSTFVRKLSGTSQQHGQWTLGQAQDNARRRASGERGQHRRPAATPVYLHGGPNRVEPGAVIHQDAMPESHGRLEYNFLTTSRQVAEDAADMRDGLGHGWIHVVKPTGPVAADHGEPDSWKSAAPLRVISVEPGHMNGTTPHPPILRQPKTAPAGDPYQAGLCGTYAAGLIQLRPDLRMGVAGDEKDDDDQLVPRHYFAHDDHGAYDSAGRHPLPYPGRRSYSQLDAGDPWVLDAEHESRAAAEEAIARAQEHAIRHRVLEGGAPNTRPASTRRPASSAKQTGPRPGEHPPEVRDCEGRAGGEPVITDTGLLTPPIAAAVDNAGPEDTGCRHLPAPARSSAHAAAAPPADAPRYQEPARSKADFPVPVHTRESRHPARHVSQARRRAVTATRRR